MPSRKQINTNKQRRQARNSSIKKVAELTTGLPEFWHSDKEPVNFYRTCPYRPDN
jgi:hypothetical protein